jgi:ATP-binding cassette subfamily B protein
VLIDGADVRDVDVASLRSAIAVVDDAPFLFSATVAENIAYARPDATPEEIETAARRAQAHDFIERLPDGYATRVGERGLTLERRPAPADRDRPRVPGRPADPDPRRRDLQRRRRRPSARSRTRCWR